MGVPLEGEPLDVGTVKSDLPMRDPGPVLRRMPRPTRRETLSSWMPRISAASAPLMPILGSPSFMRKGVGTRSGARERQILGGGNRPLTEVA